MDFYDDQFNEDLIEARDRVTAALEEGGLRDHSGYYIGLLRYAVDPDAYEELRHLHLQMRSTHDRIEELLTDITNTIDARLNKEN